MSNNEPQLLQGIFGMSRHPENPTMDEIVYIVDVDGRPSVSYMSKAVSFGFNDSGLLFHGDHDVSSDYIDMIKDAVKGLMEIGVITIDIDAVKENPELLQLMSDFVNLPLFITMFAEDNFIFEDEDENEGASIQPNTSRKLH